MKEEKAKSKKKIVYYLILAVCAMLLIAATVLTVYFVTTGTDETLEKPGQGEEDPGEGDTPPVSGDDTVEFVLPVAGYTSLAAEFYDEFENKMMDGWFYHHEGIDFTAPAGSEVRSIAAGTVTYVGAHDELGYLVTVKHSDDLYSKYYFCAPVAGLAVGTEVEKGQTIGTVAEPSGFEDFMDAHLHFEMEYGGNLVDPATYLKPVLEEK